MAIANLDTAAVRALRDIIDIGFRQLDEFPNSSPNCCLNPNQSVAMHNVLLIKCRLNAILTERIVKEY